VPLAALEFTPGPVTETELALAEVHESVADAGAVPVTGVRSSVAETAGTAAVTVKVAVRVTGPPLPCATIV
jgi:hypothetical protein